MDPKQILDSFLGAGASATATDMLGQARAKIDNLSPGGALVGGAAAGGLLALLLGSKRAVGVGSAAALGALALRAYRNWQSQQAAPVSVPAPAGAADQPFELALIRAMVGAAAADGHIDAAESKRIAGKVEELHLDAEAKAFIFDLMNNPPDPDAIAAGARTPEQASQLWLAARLAIDPDQPAERNFLAQLATRLAVPQALVAEMEKEVAKLAAPAA